MAESARAPAWTPRVLPEAQAALYVGLSPVTFRQVVRPQVPPVRLSTGRIGWRREDLDRWVDGLPLATSAECKPTIPVDRQPAGGKAGAPEAPQHAPDYFSRHVLDALPTARRPRRPS